MTLIKLHMNTSVHVQGHFINFEAMVFNKDVCFGA